MENEEESPAGNSSIDFDFDLFDLPEECIANVVSLTSPRDVCRLSLVAPRFRAAADSDSVWQRFLPSDFHHTGFGSKKELYLHLCDHPLIIDDGTLSFSLEKASGKKCYMLAARALTIVWGDTPQYWRWTSLPESRFPEVAELIHVCWLEIRGRMDTRMLSPDTTYAAYLVYKLTHRTYGLEYQAAEVSVGLSGAESEKHIAHLVPEAGEINGQYPKQRADGWLEIEMGEYVHMRKDGELQMSLWQENPYWQGGLVVQGIEIRPKESR